MSATVTHKRILLADDHAGALAQAAHLLREEYEIAGMVSSGSEALEAAGPLSPDVIILDIAMPGLDGFQTARLLKKAGCSSKLVFLTVSEDVDFVREAMAVGADAYVVKSRLASDLRLAISEVLAGHQFISPSLKCELEKLPGKTATLNSRPDTGNKH